MNNLNKIFLIIIAIYFVLISSTQGVVIQPGVILKPTMSKFYLVWNSLYEDNKSVIVDATYVQVGGIKIYCDSQMLIKIVVNGWYPENKDKEGETVFDLEFHPDKAGAFTVKFEGLKPGTKYTILKNGEVYKVVEASRKGIAFSGKIDEPTKFIIVCGEIEEGSPPESPEIPPVAPGEKIPFVNPIIVVAVIVVLALWIKRGFQL